MLVSSGTFRVQVGWGTVLPRARFSVMGRGLQWKACV